MVACGKDKAPRVVFFASAHSATSKFWNKGDLVYFTDMYLVQGWEQFRPLSDFAPTYRWVRRSVHQLCCIPITMTTQPLRCLHLLLPDRSTTVNTTTGKECGVPRSPLRWTVSTWEHSTQSWTLGSNAVAEWMPCLPLRPCSAVSWRAPD